MSSCPTKKQLWAHMKSGTITLHSQQSVIWLLLHSCDVLCVNSLMDATFSWQCYCMNFSIWKQWLATEQGYAVVHDWLMHIQIINSHQKWTEHVCTCKRTECKLRANIWNSSCNFGIIKHALKKNKKKNKSRWSWGYDYSSVRLYTFSEFVHHAILILRRLSRDWSRTCVK